MPRTAESTTLTRQQLLKKLDPLPSPELKAFRTLSPPAASDLKSFRIVDDRALRARLVNVGLIEVVQSPGQGNWSKTKAPAYIAKVYPNFDAPRKGAGTVSRVARTNGVAKAPLPAALVYDLRQKWEAYYVDSRPENQRRHEQRAQSMDIGAISARAKELIGESRKGGRNLSTRDALLRATDEMTADFETAMRRKYGDIIVDVLGIPDATDRRLAD